MIDDSAKVYSAQLKRQTIDISEADPGEGPGGPAPLIFRPNRGPEAEFFFLQGITWRKKIPTLEKVGKKILQRCIPEVLQKNFFPNPSLPQKSNGPLLSRT